MATDVTLINFFNHNLIFKDYFKGVFAFDEITHKFDYLSLNKNFNGDGSFFIYNNQSSQKNGEHWRAMIKLNRSTFFCFDSFGENSVLQQIPFIFMSNGNLFESASVDSYNNNIGKIFLNYNELEFTKKTTNLNKHLKKNSEFKWFSKFINIYGQTNNLQSITILYNKLQIQQNDSSTCGVWAAFFINEIFNTPFFKEYGYFSINDIDTVLQLNFPPDQFQYDGEMTKIKLFPFHNFLRYKFMKYCDTTAKKEFKRDLTYPSRLSKNYYNEIYVNTYKEENNVNEKDIYEHLVKSNNNTRDVLKEFDLLRTANINNDGLLTDYNLNAIPTIIQEEDVDYIQLSERERFYLSHLRAITTANQFLNISPEERIQMENLKAYYNKPVIPYFAI